MSRIHSWAREPGSLTQSKDTARPLEDKERVRWIDGYQRVNELAEQLPDTRLIDVGDREAANSRGLRTPLSRLFVFLALAFQVFVCSPMARNRLAPPPAVMPESLALHIKGL